MQLKYGSLEIYSSRRERPKLRKALRWVEKAAMVALFGVMVGVVFHWLAR
jgi:hypothetical protein